VVALLDLHPRQLPPLPRELVAQPRELLLLREVLAASREPLLPRHDPLRVHRTLLRRLLMARAVRPPVEVAPAMASAAVVRHTGHMAPPLAMESNGPARDRQTPGEMSFRGLLVRRPG